MWHPDQGSKLHEKLVLSGILFCACGSHHKCWEIGVKGASLYLKLHSLELGENLLCYEEKFYLL